MGCPTFPIKGQTIYNLVFAASWSLPQLLNSAIIEQKLTIQLLYLNRQKTRFGPQVCRHLFYVVSSMDFKSCNLITLSMSLCCFTSTANPWLFQAPFTHSLLRTEHLQYPAVTCLRREIRRLEMASRVPKGPVWLLYLTFILFASLSARTHRWFQWCLSNSVSSRHFEAKNRGMVSCKSRSCWLFLKILWTRSVSGWVAQPAHYLSRCSDLDWTPNPDIAS